MEKLMPALASYKIIPNRRTLYIIADTSNFGNEINKSDNNIKVITTNKTNKIINNRRPLYIIEDTSNLGNGINKSDNNIEVMATNKTNPSALRPIAINTSNNLL